MRSKHVDDFNHDPWADGYDVDVQNEDDPIRSGYEALLTWVASKASAGNPRRIVDLGSGTGNLTARLPKASHITMVDTSEKMHRLAKPKLEGWNLDVVTDDILSYVTEVLRSCDVIVSTYALHHLTKDEKRYALNAMTLALQPGGHLVIGDLMFEDQTSREALLTHFVKSGRKGVAQDIEEEFFWDLAVDRLALDEAGFSIEIKRFSDLSWAFAAQKPPLD